ncbi:MAG: ribonuclease P protein component [Ilumatobacteraceae bacterium]
MIHRIRTRQQFDELSRSGRRVRSAMLWCTHLPDPAQMPPSVAFAIGRAHGPAVTRNRLRRRLRAICRQMASEGTLPAGHWLWGITRSMSEQVCGLSSMELTMQVRELVQRASTDAIAR